MNILYKLVTFVVLIGSSLWSFGQLGGKLFIIGGGTRSDELMQDLLHISKMKSTDYIVVLPMATSVPEETLHYFREQMGRLTPQQIVSFNFSKEDANANKSWIDSVKNAKLIYITGGDQNRFMDVVRGTKLYEALHLAYKNGATIAGTSAGAAVMSEVMITGEQRNPDGRDGVREITQANILTSSGMGFLKTAIIDQHFIIRSRYNRLFSVMVDYPKQAVIGIDEGTAIVVDGNRIRIVGDSQVIVARHPKDIKQSKRNKVSFVNAQLSLYTEGQFFQL